MSNVLVTENASISNNIEHFHAEPVIEPVINFGFSNARFDKLEVVVDIGRTNSYTVAEQRAFFNCISMEDARYELKSWGSNTRLIYNDPDRIFSYSLVHAAGTGAGSPTLRAKIKFNPTRYYAYFGQRLFSLRTGHRNVYINPRKRIELQSVSLAGHDNYIPDNMLEDVAGLEWEHFATSVLNSLVEQVIDDLRNSGSYADDIVLVLPNERTWNVCSAEIYWESSYANAAAALKNMDAQAEAFFSATIRRCYIQEDRDQNGSIYTYPLRRKNTQCVTYAKLANRIRFECRMLSNPRSIFADRLTTRHFPARNLSQLPGFLHALIGRAEDLMADMLPFTQYLTPTSSNMGTVIAALFKKLQRLPLQFRHDLSSVLDSLIQTGRVGSQRQISLPYRMVPALVECGLLREGIRRRGGPRFHCADGELRALIAAIRR